MHDTKIINVNDSIRNTIFLFNLIILEHRHFLLVEPQKVTSL